MIRHRKAKPKRYRKMENLLEEDIDVKRRRKTQTQS
jgi:hypothetical protein